jgi:hypothetical protein
MFEEINTCKIYSPFGHFIVHFKVDIVGVKVAAVALGVSLGVAVLVGQEVGVDLLLLTVIAAFLGHLDLAIRIVDFGAAAARRWVDACAGQAVEVLAALRVAEGAVREEDGVATYRALFIAAMAAYLVDGGKVFAGTLGQAVDCASTFGEMLVIRHHLAFAVQLRVEEPVRRLELGAHEGGKVTDGAQSMGTLRRVSLTHVRSMTGPVAFARAGAEAPALSDGAGSL